MMSTTSLSELAPARQTRPEAGAADPLRGLAPDTRRKYATIYRRFERFRQAHPECPLTDLVRRFVAPLSGHCAPRFRASYAAAWARSSCPSAAPAFVRAGRPRPPARFPRTSCPPALPRGRR